MQSGRELEAIPHLQQLVNVVPADKSSLLALALCLRATGDLRAATAAALQATQLDSQDAFAWLILGGLQAATGVATNAEASLRRSLALEPRSAETWHYLGDALQMQQRWLEAATAYRNAAPSQPGEIFNIAICAENVGDLLSARTGYQHTCELYPQRADCLARLAQICAAVCDIDGESNAVNRLQDRLDEAERLLADDIVEAFPLSFLPLSHQAKRAALTRYADRVAHRARQLHGGTMPPRVIERERLRIGYLSSDFGAHAVGTLIEGLFEAHDRGRVEVYGYSLRRHSCAVASRIRSGFDYFHECAETASDDIAALIRRDGIDVLIDLGGYTGAARPEIPAMRPAPLQFCWLGFIHPHEAPWFDALLLDEHVQPSEDPWSYGDRVVRLSGTLFPATRGAHGTPDRARFGLPDGPILASFNNAYKIDRELIAAWVDILHRAPRANLLVYLHDHAREGFVRQWQRLGGDPARLLLTGNLADHDHADRAASCDLLLDAFRYQGGATSLSAIAAGLPVLARIGDTPLGRLGVSLNRHLGLAELVCVDTAAYVSRAAELANSPERLAALKVRLAEAVAASALLDPNRSARAIEDVCFQERERLLKLGSSITRA